jgi:hypothetical protein
VINFPRAGTSEMIAGEAAGAGHEEE